MKKWAQYRNQQILNDYQAIDRMAQAQTKALEELRFESDELYQHAIRPDSGMVSIIWNGPVTTPPIKDYQFVDGDYINTTKVMLHKVFYATFLTIYFIRSMRVRSLKINNSTVNLLNLEDIKIEIEILIVFLI